MLAMPHEDKPGLGCAFTALLGILIIAATLMATFVFGVDSLFGLLLLLPLIGIYSTCLRFVYAMPYPKALIVMGRIPHQTVGHDEAEPH
jgi:hypothetical protein